MAANTWSLLVAGTKAFEEDPGKLIDGIRAAHPTVMVQAANAHAVYGQNHVTGVLFISIKAFERNIMIANKLETEALLRLACTRQITEALRRVGLKSGHPACFIAFSKDSKALEEFGKVLAKKFRLDDSVLVPTRAKKQSIAKILCIDQTKIQDNKFVDFLLERAAIIIQS